MDSNERQTRTHTHMHLHSHQDPHHVADADDTTLTDLYRGNAQQFSDMLGEVCVCVCVCVCVFAIVHACA